MIHFVLGGVKSGKSRFAENQVMFHPAPWIYLATARCMDHEMQEKIAVHQKRRGQGWQTIEESINLADIINTNDVHSILVDCLTLWLTNLLMDNRNIKEETDKFLSALTTFHGNIIIVSNEVGQGIVPDNALARKFINEAGILHQKMAAIAHKFTMVVAGCPLNIKI